MGTGPEHGGDGEKYMHLGLFRRLKNQTGCGGDLDVPSGSLLDLNGTEPKISSEL